MTGFLYDLTTTGVFSLAAVWSVCSLCDVGPTRPALCMATLFCSGFYVVLRNLKARWRIALFGVLAVAGARMYATAEQGMRTEWINENRWILWVFLGCGACFLLERIAKHQKMLKCIPVAAGCTVLATLLIREMHPEKGFVLTMLLYMVLTVVEVLQLHWKKEGDTDVEAHVVYALPFIGLLFCVLCFVKAPDEPYQWNYVKQLIKDVRMRYEMLAQSFHGQSGWIDEEACVGFSTDAHLYGHLGTSAYKVLEISANMPKGTKVYLAGKTFDTFDGRSWYKLDEAETDYRMYDLLETCAAVADYDPEHIDHYIRKGHLDIEYTGLRSAYAFAPLKTIPVVWREQSLQQGGDLLFAKEKRHTYSLDFYRLNSAYEGFEALMRDNAVTDEQSFYAALHMVDGAEESGCTLQGLAAYTDHVYAYYGQAPELTEELQATLEEALMGADSDYEKLLRIEGMFAQMHYTLAPGELPGDIASQETYLSYFMADAQAGYCTHFATAFVLFARAAGIPARYVQGYCYTVGTGDTDVFSDCAHAWPEAYIKGIGWIAFEPTPGKKTVSGWYVLKDKKKSTYLSDADETEAVPNAQMEEDQDLETPQNTAQGGYYIGQLGRILRKVRTVLLPAALFFLLFLLADVLIRRYRYRHMTERERIAYLWKRNLALLKQMGLRPAEGETLTEFAVRADRAVPGENLDFLYVYEEILYGEKEVSSADTALFKTARKALWKKRLKTVAAYLIKFSQAKTTF